MVSIEIIEREKKKKKSEEMKPIIVNFVFLTTSSSFWVVGKLESLLVARWGSYSLFN